MFVAGNTGIRGAAFQVFTGKIINDMPFKVFFEVEHPVRDTKSFTHAACVFHPRQAATGAGIAVSTLIGGPCPYRRTCHFMALLLKQGGCYGAVNTATHCNKDLSGHVPWLTVHESFLSAGCLPLNRHRGSSLISWDTPKTHLSTTRPVRILSIWILCWKTSFRFPKRQVSTSSPSISGMLPKMGIPLKS